MTSADHPTDLHPEDLLARARGEGEGLSTDELERLDAHLIACEVCALELELHGEFERELVDQPGDASKLGAMVAVAVGQVPPPAGGPGPGAPTPGPGISSRAWFAFAGGVLVVVLAVAYWPWLQPPDAVIGTTPGAVHTSDDPANPEPTPTPVPVPVPVSDGLEAPAPGQRLDAVQANEVATAEVAAPEVAAPEVAAPEVVEAQAERAASTDERPSAAEIFARANRRRRSGEYDDAVNGYERLQREYQGTREALLSRVSLGKLYLSRLDRPKDALRMFESYLSLRPKGTLAEEAAVGRAMALQQLGRRAEEREAWENVLERFPDTVHAERAAARLR